ncbi:hypothetical protein FRC02_006915 [Tulasnella sp. 418]|nr:hypothetical protein FRC02_006915 [Tulasnella sp. 418]
MVLSSSFLTELAFRRHLTKLNDRGDHSQERHPNQPSSGLHYASSPPRDGTQDNQIHPNPTSLVGGLAAPSSGANPIATSLNFSNRAAVSLRTPGHFFRSFGIFTIAIVTPLTDTPSAQALRRRQSRLSPSVSSHNTNLNSSSHNSTTPRWTPGPTLASQASVIDGSWFIGAFGKWWVGGSVEVPSKDAHLLSKEEGAPPGILSMRSLIVSGPSNTQPASSTKPSPARSTTKLQKRKSVQSKPTSNGVPSEGSVQYPARSTTPPPLPKSATLPLHTVRLPPSKDSVQSRGANCPIVNGAPSTPSLPQVTSHTGSVPTAGVSSPSQPFPVAEPQSTLSVSSQSNPSHSHSRSRTLSSHLASIDANPLIADLLSQVHTSQAAVAETRLQLQSFQATSQSSTSALQTSLESHRSLKRAADQTKLDLKLRLKSLEDSKRNAEGVKREADKKLKGALSVKEQTEGKINKLNLESEKLHQKVADDEAKQIKSGLDASAAEAEMKRTLENKKKELKAAEELVASLGQRARDLEEKFKEEKARLVKVKEEAVLRRRERVERNLKESSTSSLALNIIPQPPAQPPRQAPVLPAKSTPVTILSKPDTSPPNVAPAPPIAPKTILQRRVSVSRAPAPNNGVAAQIPQQQQQQKTPSPLTLLQRRNVPEPEPLTIVPASSSHTLAAQDQRRVRALSLGGNQGVAVVNMNMNLNGGTTRT